MVARARVEVRTRGAVDTVGVTAKVAQAVERSRVREGICTVAALHTTAAVSVNENADPDVRRDLVAALARLVPEGAGYAHAEGNSPGHIKSLSSARRSRSPSARVRSTSAGGRARTSRSSTDRAMGPRPLPASGRAASSIGLLQGRANRFELVARAASR